MENELKQSSQLFENLDFGRKKDEKTPFADDQRWLTTIEATRYLRVSVSSLKMMVYRGQVRVRKLGRRNRFLRDELDRLITFPNERKVA